jgi:tight adherence protein B
MVRVLTVVVAIVGTVTTIALARSARRAESGARVSRLHTRAPWRVPARVRPALVRALRDADVQFEPEVALQVWTAGVVACALLGSWVAPMLAVPAAVAGAVAGPVALRLGRTRRERRFASALPSTLEQIGHELRGGNTVAGALEQVGRGDGPVADDVRVVLARTRLGLSLRDALAAWARGHAPAGVRAAAGALAVATTMGGHAADALDGLASSLRHRLDAVAEARSLSAQARLSAIVVGAAPLGYLALSALVDPASVTTLVGTGVGRVCLVVGLVLEGLAALWIRRIVRSEA